MQCKVQCVGTAVVAPARSRATDSEGAALLPIQETGHQIMELHAVNRVVQTQEADKASVLPKL